MATQIPNFERNPAVPYVANDVVIFEGNFYRLRPTATMFTGFTMDPNLDFTNWELLSSQPGLDGSIGPKGEQGVQGPRGEKGDARWIRS